MCFTETSLEKRTDQMAPCQMTVGSQSIENYFTLTAYAAACLRQELCLRGAQKLQVPLDQVSCESGQVTTAGRQISFRRDTSMSKLHLSMLKQVDESIEKLEETSQFLICDCVN